MKRLPLVVALFGILPVLAVATQPLPRATPESQGVESAGVLALIDALERNVDAVHSLMIVRHGQVVAEGWWGPYAPEDWHVLYSVTKSFTSTAVGFAVQEGLLDINDRLVDHFPELLPAEVDGGMRAMRIRDLLTMTTGHQDDQMNHLRARADGQWSRAFLETKVEHKPGTHFRYNSAASYMLSALVQKQSGQPVHEYLRSRLFEPLGIGDVLWGQSPEHVDLGAGGLYVRTEDLAKFGLLYLQGGRWGDRQLLPADWAAQAGAKQVSNGSDPGSNWDAGYGFQFWRNRTTGYRADGAQGQFSFILPELDTVVAITGGTDSMGDIMEAVWTHLLPALHYVALPENPTMAGALRDRLGALTLPGVSAAPGAAVPAGSGASYTLDPNEQGLTALQLDLDGPAPVLTLTDAEGAHRFVVGDGEWTRARTTFRPHINGLFDVAEQGIATTGAWTADHVFTAKLCFTDTPYTLTVRISFDGDAVTFDAVHNVRWGDTVRPTVTGRRR